MKQNRRHNPASWFAAVVIAAVIALFVLPGCGSKHQETASTWTASVPAGQLTEATRTWETCGGTIECAYLHETPPNKPPAGGFRGMGTESTAACYRTHGPGGMLIPAEGPPFCGGGI